MTREDFKQAIARMVFVVASLTLWIILLILLSIKLITYVNG